VKKDANIELFRCICMLGIVCIHVFSGASKVSHHAWALSCPCLLGFMMISGWFGIHFRLTKLLRLFGVVVACVLTDTVILGADFLYKCVGYWYVWAYVFTMLFSPVIDAFVEECCDVRHLKMALVTVGFLLWGWSFAAQLNVPLVPSVLGFGNCSGVVLLCVYCLTRILKRLQYIEWLEKHMFLNCSLFVVSGLFVYMGFRHNNSIFAFAYALSGLLIVKKMDLRENLAKFILFLSPSMFSVYLLHMPFCKYFPGWENSIQTVCHVPHVMAQFVLAVLVFASAVCVDMPRRLCVKLLSKLKTSNVKQF